MKNNTYIPITDRALLAISGDDARTFLQGLITNDINKLTKQNSLYALMLTPQGKFLYDFFISEFNDKIFIDCNALRLEEIKKKISMYKLRSKVVIEDVSSEFEVVAAPTGIPDPRSAKLPARLIIKKGTFLPSPSGRGRGEGVDNPESNHNPITYKNRPHPNPLPEGEGIILGTLADYESLRIILGIPSDKDMLYDKSFPLEFEMDIHNAIDYKKGCYVGQEVTARTHYRGTLRKKPYVVTALEGTDLSAYSGQEIKSGESKIGILCSASGNKAIALLRMEDLEKAGGNIEVGGVKLIAN